MAIGVFVSKEQEPIDEMVKQALHLNFALWQDVIGYLKEQYGTIESEWKFYSKKSGWCLKIASEKRNLLFLLPCDNYFIATVNMGESVREKVLSADIGKKSKELIKDAKVYMEGISVPFSVHNEIDLNEVKSILYIRDNSR